MKRKRVLLGVFAHPDDESFACGGTLARYAAEGAEVHVIIATDGVAGSVEESSGVQQGITLPQVRSQELTNAALALGLTSIWSLPYRDSGMRNTPDNQHPDAFVQQPAQTVIHELAGYLQRLHPQVVITHDPYGGYGHPDHIRLCETVTAAFYLAQTSCKLYYTSFDQRLLKLGVWLARFSGHDPSALGRNRDINLVEISRWQKPVHARINIETYLEHKSAASRAHISQYSGGPPLFQRLLPKFIRSYMQHYEMYTRVAPAPPTQVESDLFAGIVL
jgi:LmbE family N-acetylglucosaminyl deacetylase